MIELFLLIVKELDKLWLIWRTSFKHKQFNCPHSSVSESFFFIKLSLAICVIILKKKKTISCGCIGICSWLGSNKLSGFIPEMGSLKELQTLYVLQSIHLVYLSGTLLPVL